MSEAKKRAKPKTWGDVYNAALRRGDDHSWAAHLADQWEKRQKTKKRKDATR